MSENESDCSSKGFEMEKLPLIDFLSEDDFLVDSDHRLGGDELQDFQFRLSSVGAENIDDCKFPKPINDREDHNAVPPPDQREHKPFLEEPRRESFLRKSLAWDSAFFTNAGVLDPEELVVLNDTALENKAYPLPLIQEDHHKQKSNGSQSRSDSDSFSISSNLSFEDDLFEDIRASIERSSTISDIFKSDCESGVQDVCKKKTPTPKRLDSVSQIKRVPRSGETNSFPLKPPRIEVNARKKVPSQDKVRTKNSTPASGSGKVFAASRSTTSSKCSPVPFSASVDHGASCSPSFSPLPFGSSSNSKKKPGSGRSRLGASCLSPRTPLVYSLVSNNGMTEVSSMSSYSYESPGSSIEGWLTEPSSTSTNQGSIFLEAGFDDGTLKATCLRGDSEESMEKFRPSGLRMPSPKIGFFDEERSKKLSARKSSGALRASPKPHGETDDKRPKVKAKQTNSQCSTKKKEPTKDPKAFNTSPTPRKFPGKATIEQVGISSPFGRGNFPKARKVCDGGQSTRKLGLHSSLIAEHKRTEGLLKNRTSIEKKGKLEKLCSRARRIFPSRSEPPVTKMTENKRESLIAFEEQFEALMKHFEVIDLSNDTLVDIEGKATTDLDRYFSEKEDAAAMSLPFSGHCLFHEQEDTRNMQTKSGAESIHRERTPLANINSVCSTEKVV